MPSNFLFLLLLSLYLSSTGDGLALVLVLLFCFPATSQISLTGDGGNHMEMRKVTLFFVVFGRSKVEIFLGL